jgi:hypothetical protein
MSEYQCYELQAIDRPLYEKAMWELRAIAAEAAIRIRKLRERHSGKSALRRNLDKVGMPK